LKKDLKSKETVVKRSILRCTRVVECFFALYKTVPTGVNGQTINID